ncbi:MAG: PH domain-containing protein [Acidimicrobiia bacterium]
MPFPRKFLNSYEEIAVDLHPHWMYFAEPVASLIGAIALAIALAVMLDSSNVTLVGVVIVLAVAGWLAVRYLKWVTTNFVITTDRVIFRHGIIAKAGIEIPLERINNVNFRQTIFERIVGAGDLVIESAGKDGQSRFSDIRHPETVQNIIHAQMEGNETRKMDRLRQPQASNLAPPPPPAAAPADVVAQIERLEELRQKGVLTQAEFDASKAKLLGS